MDSVKRHFRKVTLLCILIAVLLNSWALNVYGSELGILAPNGGEIIPSGSGYLIDWTATPEMVSYKLQYSLNKGETWKTIANGITDTNYEWQVPTPTKNKNKCLIKVVGYNASGNKVAVDKSDAPFKIDVMNITAPAGGEIIPSGEYYDVTWDTNGTKKPVDYVQVMGSTNNGETWKLLATEAGNPGIATCTMPVPKKNKKQCLIKVEAYDDANQKVATDTLDSPFTIEVVHLTSPDGGEFLQSGATHIISWTTNQTKKDVSKATCFYTKNGGVTWKKIKTESGNPGFTLWKVPQVAKAKKKCKVKVQLKDANGNIIGTDASDAYFTIEQYPFVFAEVIDTDNPILAVATDDVDAIGVLGDRDFSGNPIAVTGIVYLFEQGASGTVVVGMDGLPESVIDVSNNTVIFENYTQDTVDITHYNSIGNPVAGPVTVEIASEDLAKIKTLYTQALDDDRPSDCEIHNRLTNMLKYASHTSNWAGCLIYSAVGDLFNGSQGCFSALVSNIAALTKKEAKNVFSFSLDGSLCVADPVTCLAAFTGEAAPRIGDCADIDGNWEGYEEGWGKITIDGKSEKRNFKKEGTLAISQEGCSVEWLSGNELRKGKIEGNKVTATGRLMTKDPRIKVTKNKVRIIGMVCGDEFTYKGSGFAEGKAYEDGTWHKFSSELKAVGKFSREE